MTEHEELAALIDQVALAWEPDVCLLGNMTAAKLAHAAALLRQLPPDGLEAETYSHPASGARVVRDLAPASGEPGWCWCWTVRDHRHVNPFTEFPTLAAAWAALQQASREEVGNG